MTNPYQAPLATSGPSSPYCPRCRSTRLKDPSYTFWGGMLGPKLLKHRVCQDCRFGFNRETGESNGTKIAIYVVVSTLLVLVGVGLIVLARL